MRWGDVKMTFKKIIKDTNDNVFCERMSNLRCFGQGAQLIVVLVGLVIIFKEKITDIVNSIFSKITNQTKKI